MTRILAVWDKGVGIGIILFGCIAQCGMTSTCIRSL